ncbi:helix-turn-helix transcriptional regulator [Sansalvadorimonas verongulae]|uniref:helix-turn-helix transcriptional regulator n=1 Tax=Sansalvadorimonas verongulae TaxID=2172824 RepID=UPI0012BCDCBB|nr:LuxR C-terminal-related transcriptional regulator [Sansalvadorimonas verongulae]MTI14347.1 LuxR family transcriptional regulator [Sansalvadorimonas verongulae]
MQQVKPEGRVVLSSQMAMEDNGRDSDDIFTQSSRSLEIIQMEIQNVISKYGFTSFRYSSMPTDLGSRDSSGMLNFDVKQRADGREGFGTMSDKVLRTYYHTLAEGDDTLQRLISAYEPIIYPTPGTGSTPAIELFRRYGISSQVLIPLRWQTGSDWLCVFSLQSDLLPDELAAHYQSVRKVLNVRILGWHLELMAFRQEKFNPYIVRKVLSPRARHILKLASEGLSSRAIAEMTDISDNGVNYHYREAKRVLGARNRTHLVSLAKDHKII